MNRLLSVLTDETNREKGFTVLYVPNEDLAQPPADLAQNKELVQRLEATVIHWTRQIKAVLNSTNQESTRPNELPLDEIDFWRKRVEDLSGISQQLDKPGVDRIEHVLSAAKSTYLINFSALATQIKEGMAEAQSNVKFLSTLRDSCTLLAKSDISKIADHLPHVMDLVRLIWIHSPFYNTRERITALLQKVRRDVPLSCCFSR
jgi:dynein heavy chain